MRPGKEIRRMLEEGKSYGEIIRSLNVAGSTIAYHAKAIERQKYTFTRKNRNWKEIQDYYDLGYNISETCRHFSMDESTLRAARDRGDFNAHKDCPQHKLVVQYKRQELRNLGIIRERKSLNPDVALVEHSHHSTGTIKRLVLKMGLLEYRCAGPCDLNEIEPTWAGMPIVLHLDHENGVRNDHRLSNLRFLCPNCHSQTETYCGRNKGLN